MSTDSDSSVIRKKALSGREDFAARAMSWSKALRLSLERVSDRRFGFQLSVRAVEQVECSLADLRDVASGDRLVMLLDAFGDLVKGGEPKAGGKPEPISVAGRGAAILDRGFVQSLVEVQTRGKVTTADLETRDFTFTDAAVTAQLIDLVLSSVDEMMVDTPQSPDPLRLRYGDKVEDARALLLALEAPDYVLFRITLDIEEGMRSGDMVLAIPEDMLRPPPPAPDPDELEAGSFDLSGMALSAPIPLNAVVARLNMPLARIWELRPGDRLPVERSALTKTELVGSKGFVLGKVALGQVNGVRAVRLGPDEPDEGVGVDKASGAQSPSSGPLEQGLPAGAALLDPDQSEPVGLEPLPIEELSLSDVPDIGSTAGDLPDLPEPTLELDGPESLSLQTAGDLGDVLSDGPELADLADLSGLDDATLNVSGEDLPDLPDLPSL